MTLGYAWFDSYDSVGYVLTLHIFPPYILPLKIENAHWVAPQIVLLAIATRVDRVCTTGLHVRLCTDD